MEGCSGVGTKNEVREDVKEEEDGNECERELPLTVQMEGKNRFLTVGIIAATACAMDGYRMGSEIDNAAKTTVKGVYEVFNLSIPIHGIYALIMWLFMIGTYALCILCAMQVNINPQRNQWIKRQMCACLGLVFWDFLVVATVLESSHIYKFDDDDENDDDEQNTICYYGCMQNILTSCAVLIVVLVINLGFIFLPCLWSPVSEGESVDELPTARIAEELSSGGLPVDGSTSSELYRKGAKSVKFHMTEAEEDKATRSKLHLAKSLEHWDSVIFRQRSEAGRASRNGAATYKESEGMAFEPKNVAHKINQYFLQVWQDVKEEGNKFRYSAWVIAAVAVTGVLLLNYMVGSILYFQDLAQEVQLAAEKTLQIYDEQVKKTEPILGAPEPSHRNLTDANVILQKLLAKSSLSDENRVEVLKLGLQLASARNVTSSDIAWMDSLRNIVAKRIKFDPIAISKYFVDYCEVLQGTVVVGFLIGTMIGFYAMYTVLATHKRMSLQLTQEMRASSGKGSGFGIENKYPIGNAVHFMGVMVSTALIQQAIFGVIISLGLGAVFNFRGYAALMKFCGYWVLVGIVTLLVDAVMINYVSNKYLSDGFQVKRPRAFFFYMCVFTVLHFVLGIYYALIRMVWLAVTTLFVLSRLDISVFATGKSFDEGHNAFMSTLLLARITQHNCRHPSNKIKEKRETCEENGHVRDQNSIDSREGVVAANTQGTGTMHREV